VITLNMARVNITFETVEKPFCVRYYFLFT
jgi:hypothetical protein